MGFKRAGSTRAQDLERSQLLFSFFFPFLSYGFSKFSTVYVNFTIGLNLKVVFVL